MSGGKIGIVDVGGGYRGIYAAGVLDYCIDHDIHFDLGIGNLPPASEKNTRVQRKSWNSGQNNIIMGCPWQKSWQQRGGC